MNVSLEFYKMIFIELYVMLVMKGTNESIKNLNY